MNTDKTTISKKRIVPMKVRKEFSYTTEETIWISSELYNDYVLDNLDGNNEIQDFIENETIPWGKEDCNKVFSSVLPDYNKNIEDFCYENVISKNRCESLEISEVELDERIAERQRAVDLLGL